VLVVLLTQISCRNIVSHSEVWFWLTLPEFHLHLISGLIHCFLAAWPLGPVIDRLFTIFSGFLRFVLESLVMFYMFCINI
jgi:hypothetical protein